MKWSWTWHAPRRTLCAYWHCCLPCHKLAWPGDGRQQNRYSRPSELLWAAHRVRRGNSSRLTAGDFCLTVAPPDFLGDSFSAAAPAASAKLSVAERAARRAAGLEAPGPCSSSKRRSRSARRPPQARRAFAASRLPASPERVPLGPLPGPEAVPQRSCLRDPTRERDRPVPHVQVTEPPETTEPLKLDRRPVDFGSCTCDACGGYLPQRLEQANAEVRLRQADDWERYWAFLCPWCLSSLNGGRPLYLLGLEDLAAAHFHPVRLSRGARLLQLGAPYTPKPKKSLGGSGGRRCGGQR